MDHPGLGSLHGDAALPRRMTAPLGDSVAVPAAPSGWFAYGYALLLNGDLALVRTERDIHAEYANVRREGSGEGAEDPRLSREDWRVRLSTFDGTSESEAIEVSSGLWPQIDRLPDGRWVVVASRAEPGEKNARMFGADGMPAGEFALSDGIQDVRCALDGTIWTGYLDEGVDASPDADGGSPVSTAGLAQFGIDGRLLWNFNAENRAGIHVDGSAALTVDGHRVWCCPHFQYPIVRIENGSVDYWQNDILQSRALAVEGDCVLLASDYVEGEKHRLVLVRLLGDRSERLGDLQFPMPPQGAGLVQGRGAELHVVAQGRWTRIGVAAVRAALNL